MGNRPNSTFIACSDRRGSDDAASTVDTATCDGVEAKDSWKVKLKDSLEHAGEDVKKLVHHEGLGASVDGQVLSVVEFDRIAFKFMRRIEADRWHRAMLKGIELAMNAEDEDGYVQPSTGTDGVLLDEVDDGDGGGSEDDTSGEKKVTMPHLKRLLPSVVVAQLSYFFSRSSYVLLAVPLDGVADPTSSLLLNGVSFGLAFLKLSLLSTIFGGLVIAMALLLDMAVEGGRGSSQRSRSSSSSATTLSTSSEAATAASPKSDTSSDTRRDQLTANEAPSPFEEASRDTLPIVPMKELIDQLIDEVLPTIPQQDHVDTSFPHSLPAAHHRRRQVDISQSIFTGGVHWTSDTEVSNPDCKVYSTFDLFPENQWPSFALTCRGLNAHIRDMISALTEIDRYQRCDETMDYQTAIVEENGCMIKHTAAKSVWPVSTRDYMIMFAIVPLSDDGSTAILSRSARVGEVPKRLGGDDVVLREDSKSIRGLLDYSCWFVRPSAEGRDKTDLIFVMHGDLKGNLGMVGKISGVVSRRQLVRICAAAEKEANNEAYH
ncbi:hypothetical protein FOZ63_028764 [Perkinsus olseni]|uniref:START domain-containing protein n=1 Tax=Perkinsus olseni TaxID=32597 RepID=A0A7J6QJH6_PEROL|nr:hypothetical protein FOZ63_028764 [Perkinsus olseni]